MATNAPPTGSDDDEFDPKLADKFDALSRVDVPDVWTNVASSNTPSWASRPLPWLRSTGPYLLVAAALVVAVGIAAIALRSGPSEQVADLATKSMADDASPEATQPPAPGSAPASQCAARMLAPASEPFNETIAPTNSFNELLDVTTGTVWGQLISFEGEDGGTRALLKTGDVIGSPSDPFAIESLWFPYEITAPELEVSEFIAFLTGERTDTGSWIVHPEGLWLTCRTVEPPAGTTFSAPTGEQWSAFLANGWSVEDLFDLASFPDGPIERNISPTLEEQSGALVYEIRFVEGARYRLTLPPRFGEEITLSESPSTGTPTYLEGSTPMTIEGRNFSAMLQIGGCSDEGANVNRLGTSVAVDGSNISLCRPDDLISIEIRSEIELAEEQVALFDVVPIVNSRDHQRMLRELWGGNPFLDTTSPGLHRFEQGRLAIGRLSQDRVAAIDLGNLEEVWSIEPAEGAISLVRTGNTLIVEDSTSFARIEPSDGSQMWEFPLEEFDRLDHVLMSGDSVLVQSSFRGEGATEAPTIRRIDADTGELLWSARGRGNSHWQGDMFIQGDVVVSIDADNAANDARPPFTSIRGYDLADSQLRWVVDSQDRASAVVHRFEFESSEATIVQTGRRIFRLDPETGDVIWVSWVRHGQIDGTGRDPSGSLAVSITGDHGGVLLDPNSGSIVSILPLGEPGCPVTTPSRGFIPPDPWPEEPADGSRWYGTEDLWTIVPSGPDARKSIWWSSGFSGEEPQPDISVVYRMLDGDGEEVRLESPGTNGFTDREGWFMLSGLEPSEPGCWQGSGTFAGTTLNYVFEID